MKKVAIIGAGAFGCTIAIKLARHGFNASIFESQNKILGRATKNSQNRLHLGLHYPRDLPTARQSQIGFSKFITAFPDAVRVNFDNFYALAKKNSQTSKADFLRFVSDTGISIQQANDNQELVKLGLDLKNLHGIWQCQEGVIDVNEFSKILINELNLLDVQLNLSTEVNQINSDNNKWNIETNQGSFEEFDWVVRATYGQDRIDSNFISLTNRIYEYHQTMILEVESPNESFGLTIIDGDFLSVLPKGLTRNFLVYAPTISVRDKFVSSEYPKSWDEVNKFDRDNFIKQMIDRLHLWIPNFEVTGVVDVMQTVRSIQPDTLKTDQRISSVKLLKNKYLDIWSGKIDHCVEIAEEVLRIVTD